MIIVINNNSDNNNNSNNTNFSKHLLFVYFQMKLHYNQAFSKNFNSAEVLYKL